MLDFKEQYLSSLEIDLAKSLQNIKKLDSIYIGGGTPNTLNANDFERLFKLLESKIECFSEITIELNPNVCESNILMEFKNLGINRFSIGVQSFREDKLKLLERNHSKKLAINFIENALKCDIDTSIDLIYDTILDSASSLKEELEMASLLGIGHISCYALSIDKNSRFYIKNKNPTLDNSLCYELKETLEKLNFNQYEVSNYAKTHKSKHNLGYWQYQDYIGVGLGAVGKINQNRFYKESNFKAYLKNPTNCRIERLESNDIVLEKIFLGARSEVGIERNIVKSPKLQDLLDSKICVVKDNRIFSLNYFLADEITLWLNK